MLKMRFLGSKISINGRLSMKNFIVKSVLCMFVLTTVVPVQAKENWFVAKASLALGSVAAFCGAAVRHFFPGTSVPGGSLPQPLAIPSQSSVASVSNPGHSLTGTPNPLSLPSVQSATQVSTSIPDAPAVVQSEGSGFAYYVLGAALAVALGTYCFSKRTIKVFYLIKQDDEKYKELYGHFRVGAFSSMKDIRAQAENVLNSDEFDIFEVEGAKDKNKEWLLGKLLRNIDEIRSSKALIVVVPKALKDRLLAGNSFSIV